jgi:glycosyltransferase involved in cell wall biosynthesis
MVLRFSIIIATYNRCESLKDTLDSLLKQDCDWSQLSEIIIVDNNSTDKTHQIIESFNNLFKTKLRYLKETRQGKSNALNSGIHAADGNILIFTDDDVLLDASWLNEILQVFNRNEIDIMGGRVLPLYPAQTPSWIKRNQYYLRGPIVSYDHGEDIIDFKLGKVASFIGANVVYKKSILEELGGFNPCLGPGQGTFGDDIEMFERAAVCGQKNIIYNGKALVYHKVDPQRMTLRYIASWNFQNGRYKAMKEKDNEKYPNRVGKIPTYLIRRILLGILSLLWPQQFLKNWCALSFDLGMIAGYIK